jgi:transcriptional regulator with XRE-family HTH domain
MPRTLPTTDRVQRATFALQMADFAARVGARMRELRLARKAEDPRWTQDYAARLVRDDLTGAQYARWERGEVLPHEDTVERIAEVFGVEMESFYAGPHAVETPDLIGQLNGDGPEIEERLARIEGRQAELLVAVGEVQRALEGLRSQLAAGERTRATRGS